MLENTIKGYVLSLLGLTGLVAIGLHALGLYEFPNPDFMNKGWEVATGILLCFGLFLMPKSKIEAFVESGWNLLIGMFKKKVLGEKENDK